MQHSFLCFNLLLFMSFLLRRFSRSVEEETEFQRSRICDHIVFFGDQYYFRRSINNNPFQNKYIELPMVLADCSRSVHRQWLAVVPGCHSPQSVAQHIAGNDDRTLT